MEFIFDNYCTRNLYLIFPLLEILYPNGWILSCGRYCELRHCDDFAFWGCQIVSPPSSPNCPSFAYLTSCHTDRVWEHWSTIFWTGAGLRTRNTTFFSIYSVQHTKGDSTSGTLLRCELRVQLDRWPNSCPMLSALRRYGRFLPCTGPKSLPRTVWYFDCHGAFWQLPVWQVHPPSRRVFEISMGTFYLAFALLLGSCVCTCFTRRAMRDFGRLSCRMHWQAEEGDRQFSTKEVPTHASSLG